VERYVFEMWIDEVDRCWELFVVVLEGYHSLEVLPLRTHRKRIVYGEARLVRYILDDGDTQDIQVVKLNDHE